MRVENLPDPENRFTIVEEVAIGVCSKVFKAKDKEANGRTVAIKAQKYESDLREYIEEEYRVLRDFCNHQNLPELVGVYKKPKDNGMEEIWFVMEFCENGSAVDLVNALQIKARRMTELHIAFILRETAKALIHLHSNNVIHRDVKGSNILLTKEGEVKLVDFGLARDTKTPFGKRGTCIGSPCYMAPEMFAAPGGKGGNSYNNKCDVWALGITAIELADGKPPLAGAHPTRMMFNIVHNPPPTLHRQSNWSQIYNDFIMECLEKDPECRPVMAEIIEHPFLTQLPENDYHLTQELKLMIDDCSDSKKLLKHEPEIGIHKGFLKVYDEQPKKMFVEDLCALPKITEETILTEVQNRVKNGYNYTFAGDILLAFNSNEPSFTTPELHSKYKFKSRSENAPHIFAVADSAFQDAFHHDEVQYILLSGESLSGKTHNLRLLIDHFIVLGEGYANIGDRITAAYNIIQTLTHAATPTNHNSTRCILNFQLTFASTGKLTGAIFNPYLLEKFRVSGEKTDHLNFHVFYQFFNTMEREERLRDYFSDLKVNFNKTLRGYAPSEKNVKSFREWEQLLTKLDFSKEQIESIYRIIASIILMGEIKFKESENSASIAEVSNPKYAVEAAKLLKLDEKKFKWALVNYCVIASGNAKRRHHNPDEAVLARDALIGAIYSRLVDYIVNIINAKLAFGRAVFGDSHVISIVDMFGFECFNENNFEQLTVNAINEQFQYHYNQRVFVWEMQEEAEEGVDFISLNFYDNKVAVDQLMSKPNGLFSIVDNCSLGRHEYAYIIEHINSNKTTLIKRSNNSHQFTVAHYTGTVTYDARDIGDKNRDFVPPEMLETLRASSEEIIKIMFLNLLTKTGNLTMMTETDQIVAVNQKNKWGAALVAEKSKGQKLNTLSRGVYSQLHKMRTLSSVFRSTCLELLRNLSIVGIGVHFVRCIRCDLTNEPRGFHEELVRQQIRGMAILDTTRGRQRGYPYRITFDEFLRRYKFLAFEYEENVDITKDNCRLLLVRLKMEGWLMGKTKVFLKYHNVEYLAKLYEDQVKKIVKVQALLRGFLAKKRIANKLRTVRDSIRRRGVHYQDSKDSQMSEDEACIRIQKFYRGYQARKIYGSLINKKTGKIDETTAAFIAPFARRWKCKSMFQIVLQYRAHQYQNLISFGQQVHYFNQYAVQGMNIVSNCVQLDKINQREFQKEILGPVKLSCLKIPFRFDELPFFDTSHMCQEQQYHEDEDEFDWDVPMRRVRHVVPGSGYAAIKQDPMKYGVDFEYLTNEPFKRDDTMRKIQARRVSEHAIHRMGASAPSYGSSVPSASVHDMKSRFGDNNSRDFGYSKKMAAPTPPMMKHKKGLAPQPAFSGEPDWKPALKHVSPKRVDPIKEMKMIGKKEDTDEEGDGVFNFQHMLRKTNHKRASMKREGGQMGFVTGEINIDDYNSNRSPSPKTNNVVYKSKKDSNANKPRVAVAAPALVLDQEDFSADL